VVCQVNDIKQRRLLGGNPKQKFRFAFFSPYILFFIFLLYVFNSFLFLFFYLNIENNVVFNGKGGRILVLFVVSVCFIRIRRTHKHVKKIYVFQP
jgi:hypothetical protein